MNENDRKKFAEVWRDIYSLYGRDISDGQLRLLWASLQRYELRDVTRALTAHLNDPDCGQFIPKPADVVRNIDGGKKTRAHLAWSKVDQAVREIGIYHDVIFDDPIIHATISDMGGWIRINSAEEKEWPFLAREFETRYTGYLQQGSVDQFPKLLRGLISCENRANGFLEHIPEPVVIGDPEAARMVLERGGEARRLGVKLSDVLPREEQKKLGAA